MDIDIIALIALFVILIAAYAVYAYGEVQKSRKFKREMSFAPGVYTGPAGGPWWDGKLPDKVEDYSVPRYVYENLVESTEFLPENGRIIGYRISPSLVIHSRVQEKVDPPHSWDYLKRFNGKFLENDECDILVRNWHEISELRVKAGDTPLKYDYFWAMYDGKPVAYSSKGGSYMDWFRYSNQALTLISKR